MLPPNITLYGNVLLLGMYDRPSDAVEQLKSIGDKINPRDLPYHQRAIDIAYKKGTSIFFAWHAVTKEFIGCCCLNDKELDVADVVFLYIEETYRGSRREGGFTHRVLKHALQRLNAESFNAHVRSTNWPMIMRLRKYGCKMTDVGAGDVMLKGSMDNLVMQHGSIY